MGASIPVAVVVRVSGQRQTRKRGENAECSSFDSQKARLIEFLETDERFRGKALAVKFYEGRGVSGLRFDAPHLTSLIQDILSGRYRGGVILAVDQSRVLRFGSALIGTIAKEFGAEVIFANPQAADSDLTTDILDILTFYTAKASGRKSSLVTTKKIGAQTLEWAAKQQRNGVSIRSIYAQLRKDSLNRCERGRTFSYRTLARALGTNADVLNAALSGEAENSFRDFVKAKMSRRKGSDAVLTRSQVMGAYSAYCGEQNLPVVSTQTIVKTWKQLGGKITRPNNQTRYVGFVFSPCLES